MYYNVILDGEKIDICQDWETFLVHWLRRNEILSHQTFFGGHERGIEVMYGDGAKRNGRGTIVYNHDLTFKPA